jgi:hypothetical protein
LLGRLADEFGPERVVPVAFHVDYFNDPWPDPFSDERFSRREMQYSLLYTKANRIENQSYLYLTPLLMIDGRVPMVGSNDDTLAKARAAIRQALARPAEVSLRASLEPADDGAKPARTLAVEVAASSSTWAGRPVLVEAVITVDGLTTDVRAGELKGRTYHGRYTARRFEFKSLTLPRRGPEALRLPLALEADWNAAHCEVVVLVQDEATGRVLQARRLPWDAGTEPAIPARRSGG